MENPDLSETPLHDLTAMFIACAMSNDPSDREFAKLCRDEIAKRKPKHSDIARHDLTKEKP